VKGKGKGTLAPAKGPREWRRPGENTAAKKKGGESLRLVARKKRDPHYKKGTLTNREKGGAIREGDQSAV